MKRRRTGAIEIESVKEQHAPPIRVCVVPNDYNQLDPLLLTLSVANVNPALLNGLRRCMYRDVQTLAVAKTRIFHNGSDAVDEFLAERLGMLVLHSEHVQSLVHPRDCTCLGFCRKCSVAFTLNIPPVSDKGFIREIQAGELKSDRPDVFYVSEPTATLVKLPLGKGIELVAYAQKGSGAQHKKWAPVCPSWYTFDTVITLNTDWIRSKWNNEQKQKLVASCPRGIFRLTDKSSILSSSESKQSSSSSSSSAAASASLDTTSVIPQNTNMCIRCKECTATIEQYKLPQPPELSSLIHISDVPNMFTFRIESTGSLSPSRILSDACFALHHKLAQLLTAATKLVAA